MRPFLSAILAYIVTRIVFALFDFHYRLWGESFDPGKLLVDLGTYCVLFIVIYYLLGRLLPSKRSCGIRGHVGRGRASLDTVPSEMEGDDPLVVGK